MTTATIDEKLVEARRQRRIKRIKEYRDLSDRPTPKKYSEAELADVERILDENGLTEADLDGDRQQLDMNNLGHQFGITTTATNSNGAPVFSHLSPAEFETKWLEANVDNEREITERTAEVAELKTKLAKVESRINFLRNGCSRNAEAIRHISAWRNANPRAFAEDIEVAAKHKGRALSIDDIRQGMDAQNSGLPGVFLGMQRPY